MTDLPPDSSSSPAAGKRKKKPFMVPFHALLKLRSPLRVVASGVEVLVGTTPTVVRVTDQVRERLQAQSPEPEQMYALQFWFRTPEGYVEDLQLAHFHPPKEAKAKPGQVLKPLFEIGARLKEVNREEGFVVVEVEPNDTGLLRESFDVQVWAALELLEKLPRPGRTLLVYGEYRPQSGRLVATRFTPLHVGKPKAKPTPPAEIPFESPSSQH
ncbi:hypothetical protein [Deinococcus budaensis]|uniref:Uncharacterized protein n=1 Tax=Deinococcus budaensis TaxID=1665626 RepID=A0A7W8LRV4_9DEIO|nr:hypothetical protein [Deinococcus budaensis]MBB5236298.1 hypothetical protein [Deinococcus budaensis]